MGEIVNNERKVHHMSRYTFILEATEQGVLREQRYKYQYDCRFCLFILERIEIKVVFIAILCRMGGIL